MSPVKREVKWEVGTPPQSSSELDPAVQQVGGELFALGLRATHSLSGLKVRGDFFLGFFFWTKVSFLRIFLISNFYFF